MEAPIITYHRQTFTPQYLVQGKKSIIGYFIKVGLGIYQIWHSIKVNSKKFENEKNKIQLFCIDLIEAWLENHSIIKQYLQYTVKRHRFSRLLYKFPQRGFQRAKCCSQSYMCKAVLYFFTLGGPRTRDRELLCDRAHTRTPWTGVQLLKVIMVMGNSKEENFKDRKSVV